MIDETKEDRKDNLIKENLKRAFDEKATEELPEDLLALLAKLKQQDEQNGPS